MPNGALAGLERVFVLWPFVARALDMCIRFSSARGTLSDSPAHSVFDATAAHISLALCLSSVILLIGSFSLGSCCR
jgi:hypothetical protein